VGDQGMAGNGSQRRYTGANRDEVNGKLIGQLARDNTTAAHAGTHAIDLYKYYSGTASITNSSTMIAGKSYSVTYYIKAPIGGHLYVIFGSGGDWQDADCSSYSDWTPVTTTGTAGGDGHLQFMSATVYAGYYLLIDDVRLSQAL
jgi:hypothetical protein